MTTVPTAGRLAAERSHVPASGSRPIDRHRAIAAVADLLDALGLPVDDPGLAGTPRRVADLYAELLTPDPFWPTAFTNDAGYDELVVVSGIAFTSLCEHHLLPFRGVAHVGYLPGERIVGLSKLARMVQALARRPQVQERLTAQIAEWIMEQLAPRGAGVVLQAEHLCMSIRGVRADGARTLTSSLHGTLRDRPAAREEFLRLVGQPGGHA